MITDLRYEGSVGTIGQSIAECFAVAGGNLVLVYNRTEPTPDAETRLLELGASKVTFMKCNVSDLCSCEDLVEKVYPN